ncbi:MAG: OsmC family protein [Myxococcales bacterium]|nr:OsmC family protein [Myxococcales bacterium]
MATTSEIVVTLPGGRRVDALIGGHVVRTDQPKDNGGEDTAPSPFNLFLASLGTCAGIFVQGFCAKRGISTDGIVLKERPSYSPEGVLTAVDIDIELPAGFPEKYREAVVRVASECSVKRAIAAQPHFTVRAVSPAAPPDARTTLAAP